VARHHGGNVWQREIVYLVARKQKRKIDKGPTISFEVMPLMTQRPPMRPCLLKFPPPPKSIKLETKPLPQGLLGGLSETITKGIRKIIYKNMTKIFQIC
jgi:hypothetical protein